MSNIASENKPRVPESLLARIWKGQWVKKGPLPTSEGHMIRVRSLGIENKDSGPDFLNAVIIHDDEIIKGDIELHVRSSDWRAHGHHLDPHFNGVILQVVLWDDAKKPAQLQNGTLIPTLSLYDYLNGSMDDLAVREEVHSVPSLPCRGLADRWDGGKIGDILDQSGEERFYLKSAFFEVELILEEPAQVLYQGIMGALGYTKNKEAFQKLARCLPLRVLESIAFEREPEVRTVTLQALLLGAAGLLPSQCDGKSRLGGLEIIPGLEEIWHSLNIENSMICSDWHFFRMHPKNFPTQRLLAAGQLISRYLDQGLLNGVLGIVGRAEPDKRAASIEGGFVISDLLGRGRAREIVVNVVLPFSFVWAEINSLPSLKWHVLELFRTYPRLNENQITRYLSDVFLVKGKSKVFNSAQKQQGLVHLYKTFCQEQRCRVCPVSAV